MPISGPSLPNSISHSSVSYINLNEAKVHTSQLGVLTPYHLNTGIKQYQVSVNGYNDPIMELDTANLFLGTLIDTSGVYDSDVVGENGSPTIALPLRLRRIHFWGTPGVPHVPVEGVDTEGNLGGLAEYYTYVLCGEPVRLNPAPFPDSPDEPGGDITGRVFLSPEGASERIPYVDIQSDEDEETNGEVTSWNSTYDVEGNHSLRTIIGGIPGKTGYIIRDVKIIQSGCYSYLSVLTGVGYILDGNTSYTNTIINYSTGEINYAITGLNHNIFRIADELDEFSNCIIASSGDCAEDPCAYINAFANTVIGCANDIDMTGLLNIELCLYD